MSGERVYDTAAGIIKRNTVAPAQRILAKSNQGIGAVVGETLKEGLVRLPLENIASLSNWSLRKMAGVLGGTVKTGLMAASLIPIPLPNGAMSFADVRGRTAELQEAFRIKVNGNRESFGEILGRIRGVRNDAQVRTTGEPAPQPTAVNA